MKTLFYDIPVDIAEELVVRVAVAAGKIRDMSGVFQSDRISMHRKCEVYIVVGGRNFENLL